MTTFLRVLYYGLVINAVAMFATSAAIRAVSLWEGPGYYDVMFFVMVIASSVVGVAASKLEAAEDLPEVDNLDK